MIFFFYLRAEAREIVVEASRIGGETVDPSRSITIVEEKDFRAKNPATVADILRDVPGIETVRQGGVGQTTSVFIRGARSEATLVLIDGIEANDAMAPAAGFDFSAIPATNVTRVEVYRGPQSVRFGAGALGGVINIVTNEGDERTRARVSAEGGGFGTARGAANVSGRAGAVGYSLGLESFSSAGFSAAAASDGNREPDGAEIRGAAAKLTWRPSPSTALEATARAFDGHADLDLRGGAGGDDPNSAARTRQRIAGVRGSTRFFDERLKSSLGASVSSLERADYNNPDTWNAQDSFNAFRGETRKIENENDFVVDEAQTLRATLQTRTESGSAETGLNGALSAIGRRSQSITGTALTYLYDDGAWFADVGGRVDTGAIASHRLSVGRIFEASASKVFVAHGSGFKLPSLYQLYSTYGTPDLRHESSATTELSFERKFSPAFAAGLTFYRAEFRELIDFDFVTSKYFNVARARSEGAEARASFAPAAGWAFETSATFLETRDEVTGLALLRRPKWAGTAALKYGDSAFEGSLAARFRGARPDVDPNTFARIEAAPYEVVDASLGYALSPLLKLNARVENIFDRQYQEVAGYGVSGRAVYAGIATEFK